MVQGCWRSLLFFGSGFHEVSNMSECKQLTPTNMQALVAAINYNYQVNSLTSKQFKILWYELPDILTETELKLSLHHSGLIKLAYNINKFHKLLQIIKKILTKDDNNNNNNNNNNNKKSLSLKLDNLPRDIIQHISGFLRRFEFSCKFSSLNRYLFIATQSPSHLTKLDYTKLLLRKLLTFTKFKETLHNNHHIHWLGIPGHILKDIHKINHIFNDHNQYSITHFAFTLDDIYDFDDKKYDIDDAAIGTQNSQKQIIQNILNTNLIALDKLIFLEISKPECIDSITEELLLNQLLTKCVHLEHLSINWCFFDIDNLHSSIKIWRQLQLPSLKCITIGSYSGLFGLRIIQSIQQNQLKELNLNNPVFGEDIIHDINNKLNLTNLKELHLHLLSYAEIHWILSVCASKLHTISISNIFRDDLTTKDEGTTIQHITQLIITMCTNLNNLTIQNLSYSDTQSKHHYMHVYKGILEGIVMKKTSTQKLVIKVEKEICIAQLWDISHQASQIYNGIIKIVWVGTKFYDEVQDWKNNHYMDEEQIKYAITTLNDSKLNRLPDNTFKFIWTNEHK